MGAIQIFEVSVIPLTLVVVTLFGYLLTFLLRHRLYLLARASDAVPSGDPIHLVRQHVFIIQNLEDTDLTTPLQISVGVSDNAGRIENVRLYCGKQGPLNAEFKEEGLERRVLVVRGMAALDTWKVVCETNDEAEQVRLGIKGWDLRRGVARWWIPTFPRGGVTIRSNPGSVSFIWLRSARRILSAAILLMLLSYSVAVAWLANLRPLGNHWPPFRAISEYLHALAPEWRPVYDWSTLGGLILVGIIVGVLIAKERYYELSTGVLGNEYLKGLFEKPGDRPWQDLWSRYVQGRPR